MPFAAYVTDPCDGRTQGTTGMFDSLPYRNDAAIVAAAADPLAAARGGRDRHRDLRQGAAGDDDGAGGLARPARRPRARRRDAAARSTARTPARCRRSARASRTARSRVEEAAELGCRACGTPGGGCQFLGTAATSQVVAEALGLTLPHSALAPSGQPIWLDMARRSARALLRLHARADAAAGDPDAGRARERDAGARGVRRLDEPAAAHPGASRTRPGCARPTVDDWTRGQPRDAAPRRRAARTARAITRPCRCSWPAACPR